ncbi:hypothetical protein TTHERM_00516390 (macronuclear) [Tetrahymena thermophila SB210]|uniref:Uncharacterized protein n=1 Tax=Tetrahymena thermophila (strain SB210) TaxID=312017 RepID=I7M161_TETTS|nr:hypothetical protein TTHERM_00516390 [Tetrahymena thermophila SB210]EAR95005.2 hypothetical protein TTHERM_00516390 [Tetrahymena thermophila SB210]|eukprot:XP_001015250.2 hypothetical protein TTHERM_00516390 [Tetrahymena thermophila SB210]
MVTCQLNICKKKGDKNYEYSFTQIYEDKNQISQHLRILQQFPPLLKDDCITYPCFIRSDNQDFIGFFQKNKKQSFYLEELIQSNDQKAQQNMNSELIIFQWSDRFTLHELNQNQVIKQNLEFQFYFQDEYNQMDKNSILLYHYNKFKFEMIIIRKISINYMEYYYSLNVIMPTKQKDSNINDIESLKTQILCFSKFETDSENNIYIPIVYLESENKLFGVYNFSIKQMIKESVRLSDYTKNIVSTFDKETKQFILIFNNQICNQNYIAFYSFDLVKLKYKFINMHKVNYTLQNSILQSKRHTLVLLNNGSQIVKFDRNKKFEVKKVINLQYLQPFQDARLKEYFIYINGKLSNNILYKGEYHYYQYIHSDYVTKQVILSVLNQKNQTLEFFNLKYDKQSKEQADNQNSYSQNIPNVCQLDNGEIIIFIEHRIFMLKNSYE